MEAIERLASLNGGYIRTGQLLRAEISPRAIARMVHDGDLRRVRHGTYALAPTYDALPGIARYLVAAHSVLDKLRALGQDVAGSHLTACTAHGFELLRVPGLIDVTRLDGRSGRKVAGVTYHRGRLDPAEVVSVVGRPMTDPVRAAVEGATLLEVEPASVLIWSAVRTDGGLAPYEAVRTAAHEQFRHWDGIDVARTAVDIADPRCESVGEVRSLYLFWRFGFPRPAAQQWIYTADGDLVGRVDFLWDDVGLVGEFDGLLKYGRLRPDAEEEPGDIVTSEKLREDALRRLGLEVVRITWSDLDPSNAAATAAYVQQKFNDARAIQRRRTYVARSEPL
ncbi:putative AbiEi antitoxin of type IV toxin-antitoxin system [Mumia flava]|uniref:Putative AbiEi antitoxin of type IV toxin-antitoxin system n=1 Tax=Mumia flava TaxID=1348852 RepID=A0A2M9BJS5_9ACTN|nr:type IV toxin-antitoxin system AbiEi family antitoxin domain-containing protein [Mumia flava]PJJ58203.1 putative AbiEi antitoxin of type IV toxin-antitoxin system [Mumia flava]